MKTEMTVNSVSVCPTAEERHEYFTLTLSPRRKKRLCQYDYRHTDGCRIVLLRRPDIGGVSSKTGYMVE